MLFCSSVYMCDRARECGNNNALTCNQIWHNRWDNGASRHKPLVGFGVHKRRPGCLLGKEECKGCGADEGEDEHVGDASAADERAEDETAANERGTEEQGVGEGAADQSGVDKRGTDDQSVDERGTDEVAHVVASTNTRAPRPRAGETWSEEGKKPRSGSSEREDAASVRSSRIRARATQTTLNELGVQMMRVIAFSINFNTFWHAIHFV